ncbi:MAG: hypothetical protein KME08_11365 [Aphanothece sp. CMT-3BRIN-NPC111]|nr:hypothetical protein [Aphanothece sp. CMT-3BRIN-NPC111]
MKNRQNNYLMFSKSLKRFALLVAISVSGAIALTTLKNQVGEAQTRDINLSPAPTPPMPTSFPFPNNGTFKISPNRVYIPAPNDQLIRNNHTGPEAKGKPIRVAGIDVQLPPDAYVEYSIVDALPCGPNLVEGVNCAEVPFYWLRRGNSRIGVSVNSGTMFREQIALGEEGAFDFLREAFRKANIPIKTMIIREPTQSGVTP